MLRGHPEIAKMGKTTVLILVALNALSISTSLGAPSAYDPRIEIKPSWQDNSLMPVISEPCSTAERCWEWLPVVPVNKENGNFPREESSNSRAELQRQMEAEMNSQTDPWKEDSRIFVPRTRSSSSMIRQISPKPVKKDVFVSRSWGPGGLPFSVLYLNAHGARGNNNRPTTGAPEVVPKSILETTVRRNFEGVQSTTNPTKHPNYRVALRNGSTGQPRRQYSIIPQLFISYGWGPLGK